MSNPQEIRMYSRARSRRRTLDVDLNALPPSHEIGEQGVVSHHTRSHGRQEAGRSATTLPPPIDVEALDDDVIISSPTAFAEAKNNARRNRGCTVVVDVDSDDRASRNKRRRVPTNQTIINCDLYINLESSSNSSRESGKSAAVPMPPVPPKEPTFSCPICMGPLVEEMSTKCGHIFCKACIKASIAAQGKCPTCRRKTTTRDIIRVYLNMDLFIKCMDLVDSCLSDVKMEKNSVDDQNAAAEVIPLSASSPPPVTTHLPQRAIRRRRLPCYGWIDDDGDGDDDDNEFINLTPAASQDREPL